MGNERDLLADLREHARLLDSLTTIGLPRRGGAEGPGQPPRFKAAAWPPPPEGGQPAAGAAPTAEQDSITDLDAVRQWVGDCQRCKLAPTRKNIVFGQGNPHARLMFVGEAPGADEDEQGLAFVGRAGQLLTDIIEKGLKIPRPDVFIANVIKCRPPQNRNPEPDEILSCQPFLDKQIELIKPRVIVGLGKFAGQWLLKTMEPISRIRGRVGEYKGIKVVPTYHPAFLLRTPSAKKDVWEDMKLVRALLEEGDA